MTKITRKMTVFLILLFALVLLAGAIPAGAKGGAQIRPIEDFVERQGTYCLGHGYEDPCPSDAWIILPPVENFIGWNDPARGISASFDYAGLADACAGGAFGTEMSGHISERALADGRAEVHITLHTKNALTFVVDSLFPEVGPLLFGQYLVEDTGNCGMLPSGTEAALGSSLLHLSFINTEPGALLPDLIQVAFFPDEGQELRKLSFYGQADGLLANGKPGRLKVTQTGLFMTNWMGATADGFPAEKIILREVGQ